METVVVIFGGVVALAGVVLFLLGALAIYGFISTR